MRDDKPHMVNNLENILQKPFLLQRNNGIIRVSGSEGTDLLNRLSTNNLIDRGEYDVIETVLTSDKGRIIDVLIAIFIQNDILLITSPDKTDEVLSWLDKYTIMEDVTYLNSTSSFVVYWMFNNRDESLPIGKGKIETENDSDTKRLSININSVRGTDRIVLVPSGDRKTFDEHVRMNGFSGSTTIATETEFQLWRVSNAYPNVGNELTELVNPLESGVGSLVDFEKGCYIGQEVIARLDSYDKVQRKLCRVALNDKVRESIEPGASLLRNGKNAGFITSVVYDPLKNMYIGLGCIRNAFSESGTELELKTDHGTISVTVT